ncbi:MAG: hypothetical protein N3I35_00965 [Clostridia bacterium]|nr:hypothetical protein [Clostridia bacterium]
MPRGENIAGNYLFMKFGQGVQPQFVNITETHEVFENLNMPGVSISCPIIEVRNENFVAERTALFQEGKPEKILDMDQTRILNILENGLSVGYVTTKVDNNKPVGIRIQKAVGKISLKEKSEDSFICNISIKVAALLEETSDTNYKSEILEKNFEDVFTENTLRLMKDLQSNALDPLALQVKYWAKHPEYNFGKDWLTEIYPKIQFNVTSKVKILQPQILK